MKIPIKNIYYLLSYAWDYTSPGYEDYLTTDTFPDADNLLARLMDISLESLFRRGLIKGYTEKEEEISGIKGKLLFNQTLKQGSLQKAKTVCSFDEHSFDNPLNQIIKATLLLLLRTRALDDQNVSRIRRHLQRMEFVESVDLQEALYQKVFFHSHNKYYRFVFELSRLIYRSVAISASNQTVQLRNFLNSEAEMFRIFESFVLNFYKRELVGVKVGRDSRLKWQVSHDNELFGDRVPELNTDISIFYPKETLVIDTKFFVDALVSNRGKPKYRREHLSQLMEYLRISEREYKSPARGLLLYPTVQQDINDSGKIEGFKISVATIDLSKEWSEIKSKLLGMAQLESVGAKETAA